MFASWILLVHLANGWDYVAVERYDTKVECFKELSSKRWNSIVAWRTRSGIKTTAEDGPSIMCIEEKDLSALQSLNGSNPIMQYERAARLYCEKAGLDPDMKIPSPHPQGLAVPYFVLNWHLVAEDLYDLSMKLVSMKEAANPLVQVDA